MTRRARTPSTSPHTPIRATMVSVGPPVDRSHCASTSITRRHSSPTGTPRLPARRSGETDYSVATWIAGDHVVTLSGNMTEQQLIAVARTVHEVSAPEWQAMRSLAARDQRAGFQRLRRLSRGPRRCRCRSAPTPRAVRGRSGWPTPSSASNASSAGSGRQRVGSAPRPARAQITTVVDGLRT